MIQPSFIAYQELLKLFYRKSITNHPNRIQLITKFTQRLPSMSKRQPSRQKSALNIKIPPRQQSPTHINLNKSRQSQQNPPLTFLQVKTLPNLRQFPNTSQMDFFPRLPYQPKRLLSQQKSQKSNNDSDISRRKNSINTLDNKISNNNNNNSLNIANINQEKYFNCQWIYKCNSFKKMYCFAIIYMYIQNSDTYNFTRLTDGVYSLFEENNVQFRLTQQQIQIFNTEWTKIQSIFNKKDKLRWPKIIQQSFITLTPTLINIIFISLTKEKINISQIHNPSRDLLESISKNIRVTTNYFQISHQQIIKLHEKIYQNQNIQLFIGYIKEEQIYVFSNKMPKKSETQIKKQKVAKHMTQSINKLLKQYSQNTQKILNLNIVNEIFENKNNLEKGSQINFNLSLNKMLSKDFIK